QKLLLEGENDWFFTNSEMTPASYLGQIRDERVRYAGWGQKLDLSKEIRRLTTHELVNDPTQTVEDVIRANPHLGHAGIFLWEYAPLSQWRKYSDRLTPETRTALENAE